MPIWIVSIEIYTTNEGNHLQSALYDKKGPELCIYEVTGEPLIFTPNFPDDEKGPHRRTRRSSNRVHCSGEGTTRLRG